MKVLCILNDQCPFYYTVLKRKADQYKPYLPHPPDYEGALLSVLRLQKTYNLQTTDLAEGWVFHRRAMPLGHEHMYDLGVAALTKVSCA